MTTSQDHISKITIKLLLKEPFYGHFCTSIVKRITDEVPTLAVSLLKNRMVDLMINKDFWDKELITDELKYWWMKHEILHIVFKHLLRMDDFSHKTIFNIAADLVVNQYIDDNQLLDWVVKLEKFPELCLEKEQTLDYYYKKLIDLYNEMTSDENIFDQNNSSENSWEEVKNENQVKDDDQEKNESWENLKSFLGWDWKSMDVHIWEVSFSESEKRVIDSIINNAIINVTERIIANGNDYWNLPVWLTQYIKNLIHSLKPEVNWKRVLKMFTTSSSKTYLKWTIKKVSKRYWTTPWIRIKKKNKILVAIDTSGSINMKELRKFFWELYHIYKQWSEIFVVECDTIIHNKYKYIWITPDAVYGWWWTDFNAPIEFANNIYKPDAIVYFTDLYALAPKIHSRCPILWMVSENGVQKDSSEWKSFVWRKVKMQ